MSTKNKNKKNNGKRINLRRIIILEVLGLALVLLALWALANNQAQKATPEAADTNNTMIDTTAPDTTEPDSAATTPTVDTLLDTEFEIHEDLKIINIGDYTGAYMEDGTNEVVSGVLMLIVQNNGEEALQYAEFTLPTDAGEAKFSVSTLPAGESAVLLEQNRMQYTGGEDVSKAVTTAVAWFDEPLSLREDLLKLQILDGAINVTNISGADITGDVVIYYKNAAADLYYGGITYRVRITGGMKADEIRQIMASHFSDSGSKIMFVTVG